MTKFLENGQLVWYVVGRDGQWFASNGEVEYVHASFDEALNYVNYVNSQAMVRAINAHHGIV